MLFPQQQVSFLIQNDFFISICNPVQLLLLPIFFFLHGNKANILNYSELFGVLAVVTSWLVRIDSFMNGSMPRGQYPWKQQRDALAFSALIAPEVLGLNSLLLEQTGIFNSTDLDSANFETAWSIKTIYRSSVYFNQKPSRDSPWS